MMKPKTAENHKPRPNSVSRHKPGYMAAYMRKWRERQRYAKLRYGKEVPA